MAKKFTFDGLKLNSDTGSDGFVVCCYKILSHRIARQLQVAPTAPSLMLAPTRAVIEHGKGRLTTVAKKPATFRLLEHG